MNKNLFDDSDDNQNEETFRIKTNENYAKTYNNLRKKEILQKYKDKGLDASESESESEDSSSEDETVDPSFEKDFLKTLASLKSKDSTIYDKNTIFFTRKRDDEESSVENDTTKINKGKKPKPITLKDYERKIILEKDGKFVDDTDDDNEKEDVQRSQSPTLVEEEQRLRAEFKKAVNQDNDSSDEEFGGIFKKREKTKAEKLNEDEDYLKWLAGKKESVQEEVKQKLEPLKNYWSNDKLPAREKFLRDYVLNKGYTEATNYNEIPTYEEIVGDQAPLSEDEEELEKQAEFEQKYNFRYEEPDHEFIKRYPRTIETSLRLTEDRRKKKRLENKERKLQEKQEKLKELEIIKEMKRKEIQEKIEKLKLVTGNDDLGIKNDDLEEDFDPDAHDRRMQELFNDDYYQIDEGEEKPLCPSDIEELKVEDWDNYDPQQEEDSFDYIEPHCEDDDFNMDCDYDPVRQKEELQKELIENTKKRRGGRKGRRDRFMELIKSDKPVFDPQDEKTYGEYIDEYYKLDCEDIIGDTPCRFKYVETAPNDFGLTIEEILLAKNKELNQWASLKKTIQIKPDHVEKKEQRLYKLKAKNEELKRKIFKSLYDDGSENESVDLNKEESKQEIVSNENTAAKLENTISNSDQEKSKATKKKRKRKAQNTQDSSIAPDGNYVENKEVNNEASSFKKSKTNEATETDKFEDSIQTTDQETVINLKKKKKKNINQIPSQSQMENVAIDVTNEDSSKKANVVKKKLSTIKKSQKPVSTANDTKIVSKNNPFAKSKNCSKEAVGFMPPLRKNVNKRETLNDKSNTYKAKFQNKKSFRGKFKPQQDAMDISDERLQAYGINPKKFHKKQKYGNVK